MSELYQRNAQPLQPAGSVVCMIQGAGSQGGMMSVLLTLPKSAG